MDIVSSLLLCHWLVLSVTNILNALVLGHYALFKDFVSSNYVLKMGRYLAWWLSCLITVCHKAELPCNMSDDFGTSIVVRLSVWCDSCIWCDFFHL